MKQHAAGAVWPGKSYPLGATFSPAGVNFSLYSKSATAVELLFFDDVEAVLPARTLQLSPSENRTFHYWHVLVPGICSGQLYAYGVQGPRSPEKGMRFDGEKVLLDPYGRGVAVGAGYDRGAATQPGDNSRVAMKSVVVDLTAYDWEGDLPLWTPFPRTVIYELHVRGFTKDPSSSVSPEKAGTYAGLIEKIPYLQELGVTAIELLPVFQFDEQDCPDGLTNYWGYSPVSFFAPHLGYSTSGSALGAVDEFRDMVKAVHRAGLEVILDVVFNHTAEGDHRGPTFCFRGLENSAYYITADDGSYPNYSGTGNTLNANHSVVRRMIIDSLKYWVEEMHVDGFRFDLASVLARGENGEPQRDPPTLWSIESDPVLAGTKLIAEAWDAAGLYQVGSFIGDRWKEWNGKFRDDVRAFVKGDRGATSKLSARILASPDIYGHREREPDQSINFVTCHDGFTLNDLVSYNDKHNEANREGNRDGGDHNLSWNCGVEGPTTDPTVERLRQRQVKNFFAISLLALGVPMISMGDEVRRTQRGNNNVYCQDSELSWFDWRLVEKHEDLLRFVQKLIRFRLSLDRSHRDPTTSLGELLENANIEWHGVELGSPNWGSDSQALAVLVVSLGETRRVHLMFNSFWQPLEFELPPAEEGLWGPWRRLIDTSLTPPDDFVDPAGAPLFERPKYLLESRSVALLLAERRPAPEVPLEDGSSL